MRGRAKLVIWGWGIAVTLCAVALCVVLIEGEDPAPEQTAAHPATASDAEARLPAFPGSLADSPEFLKSIEASSANAPPRPYPGSAAVTESPAAALPGPVLPPMNAAVPAGGIEPLAQPILPSAAMPPTLIPPVLPASTAPPSRVITAGPYVPPTPVIPAAYPVPGAPTAPVVPAPTMTSASGGSMPIAPPAVRPGSTGPAAPAIVVPVAPPGQAVNRPQPAPQQPVRVPTLSNLVYPSLPKLEPKR